MRMHQVMWKNPASGICISLLSVLMTSVLTFAVNAQSMRPSPTQLPANFSQLSGPLAVVPAPFQVLNPGPDAVQLLMYDPPIEMDQVEIEGQTYTRFQLTAEASTMEPGTPQLPVVHKLIMIGNAGNVAVHVTSSDFHTIENVDVSPCDFIEGEST